MSAAPSFFSLNPLICRVDKAAYPHFNIYPPCVQALAGLKETLKTHKEHHDEAALHLPTTILVCPEYPTATDRVSSQPQGLTTIPKNQELFEEPLPLSLSSTVSPLRLRRKAPPLKQLKGRNFSPPRPRVSPALDSFTSIETWLSQSEDETAELLDMVSMAPTRSQSLSVRPTTPKKRQSALITQRIKALNATAEPPEPISDRPIRRSTKSLPIYPTST